MKAQVSRLREMDQHEVGRPHFRFKNPIQPGILEFVIQALYDYYEVALNTQLAKQRLFSGGLGSIYTPAGGTPFYKNKIHTNLSMQASLSPPDKFAVQAISILIRSDAATADAIAFLFSTQVTFMLGSNNKPYFEGLAVTAPAGYGVFVQDATVGAANNGWPVISNQQSLSSSLKDPVYIEQQQTFAVELDPTQLQGGAPILSASPGTGIKAWARLEGQWARGVQ